MFGQTSTYIERGVGKNFNDFCKAIQVKNQETISLRYRSITKRLNRDFWETDSEVSHSLYVGSYGRNTGIEGISDIDVLFELPFRVYERYNNYTGNGQSALLQAVKNSIATSYPNSSVGGDGQVVVVRFQTGPPFEVLPAFICDDNTFLYPDSNNGGSWQRTNPKAELAEMQRVNSSCNENLKWLCRMMRVWKDYNAAPISGFLIDTLAYQFLPDWEYKDKSYLYYDFLVRDFLGYLSKRDSTQSYWLAPGSSRRVDRHGPFEKYALAGHEIAKKAIEHEDNQRPDSARNKWRELFGRRYP